MSRSYWREHAERAIVKALAELPGDASKEQIVAKVAGAYPFGPKQHHPYKKWLEARSAILRSRYPQHFKPKPSPFSGLFQE